MERWQSKVLALFIMWIIMLLVTLAPFLLVSSIRRRGERGERLLCTLSCFTGGIFLGTCLVFLIPEVSLLVGESLTRPLEITYPVAELIIGAGFFLVMFAEKLVHVVQGRNVILNSAEEDPEGEKVAGDIEDNMFKKSLEDNNLKENSSFLVSEEPRIRASLTNELTSNSKNERHGSSEESVHMLKDVSRKTSVRSSSVSTTESSKDRIKSNLARTSDAKDAEAVMNMATSATEKTANAAAESAKTFILLMALSLDCVLGGVSLGLQRSVHAVWSVLLGICAHESVVGFSLGVQLSRTRVIRPAISVTLAVGYASFGPLGVLVGTLIMESVDESRDVMLINGILQGIATGVFIYVTFFEILNDKVNGTTTLRNILAIFLGFIVMAAIAGITPSAGGVATSEELNSSSASLYHSTINDNDSNSYSDNVLSEFVRDFNKTCNCSEIN